MIQPIRPPRPPKVRVCPFTVLIDNREQLPYTFDSLPPKAAWRGEIEVPTERCYLVTGDYTISGLEDRFALERKSLSDLYATIGQHRERFEAEIQRLQDYQFAAVIIEATLREVWNPATTRPDWISRLKPRAVEATIVSWSIRYPRVHWWTVGGRREGEVRAFEAMEQFWSITRREAKRAQETV